jgi:cyclopropane-fatty-acyl-phospholipid synthase
MWTSPGSWFALQTLTRERAPRDRADIAEIAWVSATIFPGATIPRLETIIASLSPYWEVMHLVSRRSHYVKTLDAWLQRLQAKRARICTGWGGPRYGEYERYLRTCMDVFDKGYCSLAQVALRRVDETTTRPSRRGIVRRATHD